ncbi:MutS protein homolog 5 [Eumeta japonica]|uniref:MutS protein homolog 5 n=1 Tax=Eumeta variegata TaxID=151549 RepID=A0A4C1T3F2_EUMVA|nr:MutS protein homolog 5 [Eumeta japonica]
MLTAPKTYNPLVHAARQDIRDIVAEVRGVCLFWMRAHPGTAGNERADELARNAALKRKTAADYDRFPLSYVRKVIRTVDEAYKVLSRVPMTPLLSQTLTGHGGFGQHLNRFKLKNLPYYACAPDKEYFVRPATRVRHRLARFERSEPSGPTYCVISANSALPTGRSSRRTFVMGFSPTLLAGTDAPSLSIVTVGREQVLSNTEYETSSIRQNNEKVFLLSKRKSPNDIDPPEVSNDSHEAEEVDESPNDEPDHEEKVMAVYCKSGRLGAAYYNAYTSELHVLDELADRPPDYCMLDGLYRQVEPSYLLAENKRQSAFLSRLKAMLFAGESDRAETRCKLILVSAKEYNYEACKRRIYSLSLCGEPPHCSEDERVLYLRTVTDFNATSSVHALGTLLRYLDLNWPNLGINSMEKPNYLHLKKISLASIMYMDEDTYRGLQIFSRSAHPSAFKRGTPGSSREGLSLYSLFNKCCSKTGRARMRYSITFADERDALT